MKHTQWICLVVLGMMMVVPACTKDSVDNVPAVDKVPVAGKVPVVDTKNKGTKSGIQRTNEPITREWCIRAYYLLSGIEGNTEEALALHYKDVYECINLGEFEVMAKTKTSAGVAKTKFNERTWYWELIANHWLSDQLKESGEFLEILEEANDAGTFDGSLYNRKFFTHYLNNKYKGLELLKQYAKHKEWLADLGGISYKLIYETYKEGELTYEQFRNLCMRYRHSAKRLIEKDGQEGPFEYDIFKLNEEQMEEEYGKGWRIEACHPDPDFGFTYIDDCSSLHLDR